MKTDVRTYFIKVKENGKVVSMSRTKSLRRFLITLRLVQFTELMKKSVSIRVTYGEKVDHLNKLSLFENSGTYLDARNLMLAAKAFTEEK